MTDVLVVGCGVVGPVTALLLKKKGYNPVIVEKVKRHGDAGLVLGMFPNGIKVLSTLGLEQSSFKWTGGAEYTSSGEYLGTFDQTYFQEDFGFQAFGIRRTELQRRTRDAAAREGIAIHQDWELQTLEDTGDGIIATAKDGRTISASFAIGCDGLHSKTRTYVLSRHGVPQLQADNTGLVMVGGFSPRCAEIKPEHPTGWYGDGAYAISYVPDEQSTAWAVVMGSPNEQETWQHEKNVVEEREKLLQALPEWPKALRDLIGTTEKIVKFGLYDRPELPPQQWFYDRCVLMGDAAHPTSPHHGQGANQSLEDTWHLTQLLPEAGENPSTEILREVFLKYAEKRQPRTAMLTKGARAQGELRVTSGKEACEKRNEVIRAMWGDKEAVRKRFTMLFKEPF